MNDGSQSYYPSYDGNGNVSEYLNSTSVVVAHYKYDVFGQAVASGIKADDFTHLFSTKQLDRDSGLYYYGYRYYDKNNGRWLGRDPITERGGINLYGFVNNDGMNRWDYLGLFDRSSCKIYKPAVPIEDSSLEGLSVLGECCDGKLVGFSVNLTGNNMIAVTNDVILAPNTRLAVQVSTEDLSIDGDIKFTLSPAAKVVKGIIAVGSVTSMTFSGDDGTYQSMEVTGRLASDSFLQDQIKNVLSNVPGSVASKIAAIPSILSSYSKLTKCCE